MSAKTAPFPAFLHLQSVTMGEGADHNSLQEKMELSNLSLMNTRKLYWSVNGWTKQLCL